MTTTVPVAKPAQAFLSLLLSDLLGAGGTPILTFLAAFGAANGDPLKIEMAWIALQGGEIGQVPTFESMLSNQIATALAAKVQALMTSKAPPPLAAYVPAVTGGISG
jgi:hypothetical protein